MRFHPRHVAVMLLGDPFVKMGCCVRDRIRMRDADGIEAFIARARDQFRFNGSRVFQKSRLA
jgi:hypothetical protein